jgi:hypothetical protein
MRQWLKRLYHRLPFIRELRTIEANLFDLRQATWVNNFVQLSRFFRDELARNPKYQDPRKLNHHEFQVFSQNGEDGILTEIFRRIGPKSRLFVETGVGDGLENNTVYLLTQGWRGGWIEGDSTSVQKIRRHFHRLLAKGDLALLHRFVTAENVESLLAELGTPPEFDLLSLDLDLNTYHVWKAIRRFQPRVVAVEYNATFPPDMQWVIDYSPDAVWNNTARFGASLKAYERLAEAMGYALVGCDFSGTNAFFIRKTEALDLFAGPFTAETHYEPPRYWAVRRESHPRAFLDQTEG